MHVERNHSVFGFVKALALTSVLVTVPMRPVQAADVHCIDGWSDAAPVVAANGLVKIESLSENAAQALGGAIVKATLCKSGSGYSYDLVVRTDKGRLKSVTVDARKPF